MEGIASVQGEVESDYGSDLDSDEEVSLTELLHQAPLSPPLLLKDIEDHEGPRTARILRELGRERREFGEIKITPVPLANRSTKQRLSFEIQGHRSVSAPGTSKNVSHSSTD